MTSTKTTLDQIEIRENGVVQLRFKLSVTHGEREIASEWHRATIDPGASVQIAAVNTSLAAMGYPAVSAADIAKIQDHVGAAHKPEVIERFREYSRSILRDAR